MMPLSVDPVCPWHLWILTVLPVACCLFGHFFPQQSHLDFAIRLRSLITALQITTKFFPVLETLYHKTCTKYFPVLLRTTRLLCSTRLAQSISQYYFVLHSCTTYFPEYTSLYCKTCTKHFPVATTSHGKVCTKYFPVLLCTTKLARSTSQYYFVLHNLHKVLPSSIWCHKTCTKYFPVLCLRKILPSTTL